MKAYLFLGGPCDGTWRAVQYHSDALDPYTVLTYRGFFDEPIRTLYYRRQVIVPGWLIPLTFYTTDPLLPIKRGTVLPGCVQGERQPASMIGPWVWLEDGPMPLDRLHSAVRDFNRERLAR